MITDERIKPGERYKILPDGRWEIYLDATMTGTFGKCQQHFDYAFMDNWQMKGERPFARDLGSWWSSVMEIVYSNMAKGILLDGLALPKVAMEVWNTLQMDDLEKYHPKQFKEFGGRFGAMSMICDYATRQLPIDHATWKIVAAESSFGRNREVLIGETDLIKLYWMGQPDLYVISSGRLMPVDHKSVSYIDPYTSKRFKPHIQIPGFIIAGQILVQSLNLNYVVDRAIINCVARSDRTDKTDTGKYPRFKRISVHYTPTELDEWRRIRIRQAEQLRRAIETDTWTRDEYACTSWFYRECPYHRVCSQPPEVRLTILNADYLKRDPWIPGKEEKETSE